MGPFCRGGSAKRPHAAGPAVVWESHLAEESSAPSLMPLRLEDLTTGTYYYAWAQKAKPKIGSLHQPDRAPNVRSAHPRAAPSPGAARPGFASRGTCRPEHRSFQPETGTQAGSCTALLLSCLEKRGGRHLCQCFWPAGDGWFGCWGLGEREGCC